MALTRQEVDDIALLARLHLDDAEAARMQDELGAILAHFAVLATVDTAGVAPMLHAVPMDLPLRDDVAGASLPVADALAAAPARDGDYLVVPAIIPGAE
jgi:aspartyl-tRNA(Asn)/glutamyl-tRNA(Gln) amidotransferase subunit C